MNTYNWFSCVSDDVFMCIVAKLFSFLSYYFLSITKSNNVSNVYSLFRSLFYNIYNFCTGGSSENNDKILFEPHRMVCSYRHEAKLVCTATFDKEECAGRQTDDTSPSYVSFMKLLQGAHGIKSFFAE